MRIFIRGGRGTGIRYRIAKTMQLLLLRHEQSTTFQEGVLTGVSYMQTGFSAYTHGIGYHTGREPHKSFFYASLKRDERSVTVTLARHIGKQINPRVPISDEFVFKLAARCLYALGLVENFTPDDYVFFKGTVPFDPSIGHEAFTITG